MRWCLAVFPLAALAASSPEATIAPRTTPPTITTISPTGAPQGGSAVFKIDGSNLAGANAVFFSQLGIKGRITRIETLPAPPENRLGSAGLKSTVDLGPIPQRNVVSVEVDVEHGVEPGPVALRLLTPLGLTTAARFTVEPHYPEAKDLEPNDDIEHAAAAEVPSVLVGAIAKPGDVDYYKFTASAGDRMVFENGSMQVGSVLRPAISILDGDRNVIQAFDPTTTTGIYAHEFKSAGTYYLRIADFEEGGSARH
ncbi:MAG TPA: PPC domain-containing protein, partial [Bryobacteraceae bacterium]